MGKAGKWIRNFLLGKKEEKLKKIDTFCTENKSANMGSEMAIRKVKRRWSLGKLTGGSGRRRTGMDMVALAGHKFSRSFDSSGDSAKLQIQALLQNQAPKSLPTALAQVSAAATKIQAAFRSYLARKALHALRGLVRLQALVRGHLVRKQATETLRGMHALMAIQVRARIHRVEEANLLRKQPPQHREYPHHKGLIRENKDSDDMSLEAMLEVLKSRRDRPPVKSIEHDSVTFCSKRTSVLKRQHQYKENTLITAPNSPENYREMSEFNSTTTALSTSQRHPASHSHRQSNYMNKTESSSAKARSRSEPKQRPKRGMRSKSKSVECTKEPIASMNGPRQSLSSNSSRLDHGSLDHWMSRLYGSMKDSRRDSFGSSTVTSDSYY